LFFLTSNNSPVILSLTGFVKPWNAMFFLHLLKPPQLQQNWFMDVPSRIWHFYTCCQLHQ
jgi:hypothetical protein